MSKKLKIWVKFDIFDITFIKDVQIKYNECKTNIFYTKHKLINFSPYCMTLIFPAHIFLISYYISPETYYAVKDDFIKTNIIQTHSKENKKS